MRIQNIREKVRTSQEYSFLRTDEHLGENICLLTMGGSHAYGMDTDTSDIDIRGCLLNGREEILTGNYYEQFTNDETDTVIYSLNKFLHLLSNCNPNAIEMLGCLPEHYLYLSDVGKELLENRHMFLSKRCVNAFGGYANEQLRRLQNAMARDSYPKAEREKHILNTIRNMRHHLAEVYPSYDEGSMKLYIAESAKEGLDTEIFVDLALKGFPLRDYRGIMSEMNTVINEYSKLNKRNTKKDKKHLMKHMAHLLRLYMMAIDIMKKHEIITYRTDEHKLLMDVRNGAFLEAAEAEQMREAFEKQDFADDFEYKMGKEALEGDIEKMMTKTYRVTDEFWNIFNGYESRFENSKKHTTLPDQPDYDKINNLKAKVNYRIVTGQ